MNMNRFKKTFLTFIMLFVICFSIEVFAEESSTATSDSLVTHTTSEKCKKLTENELISHKYNPSIDLIGNNYVIKINPNESNLSNVKFYLVDAYGNPKMVNGGLVYVSKGKPAYIYDTGATGEIVFRFRMDKTYRDPDCTAEDMSFVLDGKEFSTNLYFEVTYENEKDVTGNLVYSPISGVTPSTGHVVNCAAPIGEFDDEFCLAKRKAQQQDVNYSGAGKINYTDKFDNSARHNDTTIFKCDSSAVYSKAQLATSYYTPENISYMFGSGTFNKNFGKYGYHFYGPDDSDIKYVGNEISCKVKCEEAVTVQYGTPVASKAGLCFEYKVKVTSRVSCEVSKLPDLPNQPGICTPAPKCTGTNSSGNSYTVTEGGPNEDFDSCILDCDGGKYTSSCSKKCYKDVYQDSLINYVPVKNNANYNNLTLNSKQDCNNLSNIKTIDDAKYCNNQIYKGYYNASGSTINWDNVNSGYSGRWYTTSGYNGGHLNRYGCKSGYVVYSNHNGICRHLYKSGKLCKDNCRWRNSCLDSGKYLNPYFAQADYVSNMEIYNNAVRECSAAASCSTKTAYFTISVDYKNESNEVVSIEFPYNVSDGDQLSSTGISTKNNASSTLLDHDHCYNSPSTATNQYMAEWGFPGSWVNKKTGEISYSPDKDGDSAWKEVNDKFCIPFDAQDVNKEWWNYYYYKLGKNTCQSTVPPVEYNIKARAKDFGYFEWDIGIDCFYALNKDDENTCPNRPVVSPVKYVIRSVDLKNLFPATDGSSSDANSTGRTPGFNWSEDANNGKLSNYPSSPLAYAKEVQNKGYDVYSDEELDYRFILSTSTLRELNNSSRDFTKFDGEIDNSTSTGLFHYKSDVIRELANRFRPENPDDRWVYPGGGGIPCNNIKSGSNGSTCETH